MSKDCDLAENKIIDKHNGVSNDYLCRIVSSIPEMIKEIKMHLECSFHWPLHFVSINLLLFIINLYINTRSNYTKDCNKSLPFLLIFESKFQELFIFVWLQQRLRTFQVISAMGLQCRWVKTVKFTVTNITNWWQCILLIILSLATFVQINPWKTAENLQRGNYIPGVRPGKGQKSLIVCCLASVDQYSLAYYHHSNPARDLFGLTDGCSRNY